MHTYFGQPGNLVSGSVMMRSDFGGKVEVLMLRNGFPVYSDTKQVGIFQTRTQLVTRDGRVVTRLSRGEYLAQGWCKETLRFDETEDFAEALFDERPAGEGGRVKWDIPAEFGATVVGDVSEVEGQGHGPPPGGYGLGETEGGFDCE